MASSKVIVAVALLAILAFATAESIKPAVVSGPLGTRTLKQLTGGLDSEDHRPICTVLTCPCQPDCICPVRCPAPMSPCDNCKSCNGDCMCPDTCNEKKNKKGPKKCKEECRHEITQELCSCSHPQAQRQKVCEKDH